MFRTSIVLVDDDEEYLNRLNRAFANSGQPCLPVKFDRNDPENETGIDHVIADTRHARIIAIDINLRESQNTQEAKQLYPTIEDVLKKLNPVGPYYLIFWSRYRDLPEQIFQLLSQRSKEIITAPVGWGFIDKTEFTNGTDSSLKDKLLNVLDGVKVFRLLYEWELRAGNAASNTLSELYKIAAASNNQGWDVENTTKKLVTLLTHIAHASTGHQNAKRAPNHSIETGLMPILEDNLVGMMGDANVQQLDSDWKFCLSNLGNKRELENLDKDDISRLNAFYNIQELPQNGSKLKRGVFVNLADQFASDPNKFESYFGRNFKSVISDEFLFNIEAGGKSKRGQRFRDKARNNTIIGWLEVGAACDHAQLKNRLHKVLLSALVPEKYFKLVSDKKIKRDKAHEGIYRTPAFNYRGGNYILLVSFRYVSGLHENSDVLGVPLFRLKEQIINEVAFAWGKHAIRPGITSFF